MDDGHWILTAHDLLLESMDLCDQRSMIYWSCSHEANEATSVLIAQIYNSGETYEECVELLKDLDENQLLNKRESVACLTVNAAVNKERD